MNVAVYDPPEPTASAETAPSDRVVDRTPSEVASDLSGRGIDLVAPEAADLLLTVGLDGLRAAVIADEQRPLFPIGIDAEWSPAATDVDGLADTVSQLADETASSLPTTAHRPLELSVADTTATAVCDCTLLTTQPARISEYAVEIDGLQRAEFRADGVVAATPLGSWGYARAAGGPRLAPDTGVAVVPIAPFAMQADNVVATPPLSLSVERDTEVTVFADDRRVVAGGSELTVDLSVGSPVSIVEGQWALDRQ
ncbi:NAD(+)/NADH kinase [Halonotius terrestris]|uniref:NAD(+)/NADH kinase n=1 Tax=Halonotius terrestris TaxID=2487750 RepID=A0A8J8PCK9_9EURY|nr:NAD(+)/NADH kinase [Halonotius terrestris]TQQ82722.1 NAD(+)/NADH kinase [Halonotius terrestris]